MKTWKLATIIFISSALPSLLLAKGVGTTNAITLLEAPGSKAAALGEAFTAGTDDITAFGYNPASLSSLKTGQASFLYQKGSFEDAFAHLSIGSPISKTRSLGLSVGYYNGGDVEIVEGGASNTFSAQQDLLITMGLSQKIGAASIGVTGKYFSSELVESEQAQAYAADVGLSVPLHSRVQFGMSAQNFGTQLKFVEEGEDLPRIARAGMALNLVPQGYKTTLLLDAPYHMNEEEWRPAVGVEVTYGVLALRGGYRPGNDLEQFSIGTGFLFGASSLDYSFGLVENLDTRHRVSMSMRFGTGPKAPTFVKKKKVKPSRVVFQLPEEGTYAYHQRQMRLGGHVVKNNMGERIRRYYKFKKGDSLEEVAYQYYGDQRKWLKIYQANKHLIDGPDQIEDGQKIIIPY